MTGALGSLPRVQIFRLSVHVESSRLRCAAHSLLGNAASPLKEINAPVVSVHNGRGVVAR